MAPNKRSAAASEQPQAYVLKSTLVASHGWFLSQQIAEYFQRVDGGILRQASAAEVSGG
jgi:hypothetical protein